MSETRTDRPSPVHSARAFLIFGPWQSLDPICRFVPMSETSDTLTTQKRIDRGVAAWERDDYSAALADFDRVLEDHPDFPDVRNKAGLCHAMLGELDEALEQLDTAVEVAPDYAEAHLNRAIVLNSLGRFAEAKKAFSRAGDLDRRDHGRILSDVGNRIAVTHATLGELYMTAEHFEEAIREFQHALDVRPGFLDIRTKLAESLIELERLDQAREELEGILNQNPDFTGARLRLGVVLKRQGDASGAVREWERCLEKDGRDRRARAYLAGIRTEGDG